MIRDPVNRGKAERLNAGFRQARHELVAVIDADTHLHPQALKLLAARMCRIADRGGRRRRAARDQPRAAAPGACRSLEFASIIGLIRRTQSLTAGSASSPACSGMFRRDRVLAVGGYDPRMATEDIDLTWRLLLAGWHTVYEPHALVGMQVPSTLRGAVGAAQALGARPGRGAPRPLREVDPLAQPPHVAARDRESLSSLSG